MAMPLEWGVPIQETRGYVVFDRPVNPPLVDEGRSLGNDTDQGIGVGSQQTKARSGMIPLQIHNVHAIDELASMHRPRRSRRLASSIQVWEKMLIRVLRDPSRLGQRIEQTPHTRYNPAAIGSSVPARVIVPASVFHCVGPCFLHMQIVRPIFATLTASAMSFQELNEPGNIRVIAWDQTGEPTTVKP